MTMLTWLPQVLRDAGNDVYVMPGAETRSTWVSGMPARPPGVIWHHTATGPRWADGHVAALLRDGTAILDGPLAQIGVERDGTIVIVAMGRCNHDGYGHPWGNTSIGLEFYNAGDGVDPWPDVQIKAGQRAIAAILLHLGWGVDHCLGHKESASHKIDPRPLNMDTMRVGIGLYISQLGNPQKPSPTPQPLQEEDMTAIIKGDQKGEWYLWDLGENDKRHIIDQGEAFALAVCGAKAAEVGYLTVKPISMPQALVDDIPTRRRGVARSDDTSIRTNRVIHDWYDQVVAPAGSWAGLLKAVKNSQGDPVDEQALAEALAPLLATQVIEALPPDLGAATSEMIEAALENVLRNGVG